MPKANEAKEIDVSALVREFDEEYKPQRPGYEFTAEQDALLLALRSGDRTRSWRDIAAFWKKQGMTGGRTVLYERYAELVKEQKGGQ